MKLDLPIRSGNMYIKFNKENVAEYGFRVKGGTIEKFINFDKNKKNHSLIILPSLNADEYVPTEYFDFFMDDDQCGEKYINGNIIIEKDCFSGIKYATIVVPINTSVKLCHGCFDEDAQINFVVSPNMDFKQIFRTYPSFDYEKDGSWTLLADKRIDVDFYTKTCGYGSANYQPTDKRWAKYDLSINNKYQISDGQMFRIKQTTNDEMEDTINQLNNV